MVKQESDALVGVLLGFAPTPEKATQIAETHRQCPYCVSYRSAGRQVTVVLCVPPERRWWLKWAAEAPYEVLGLESATVYFPQAVEALSPWARGMVSPNLEQTPCGLDCRECLRYDEDCPGCPATRFFLGDQSVE